MSSWNGMMLRVDLGTGKIEKEDISREFRLNFLGGRGINSKLLYDSCPRGTDPLSPANVLIIGTGTLDHKGVPGMCRSVLTAKSPLTGIHGDSNAGGDFGIEMKRTGYDHIVVKGKAERPVYLWINNGKAEIKDASHLWGKSTWETSEAIKRELGDDKASVIAIGQAGENLVRYACVVNGLSNTHGRSGMGAVMGSKNLKAVAVRGSQDFNVAYPDKLGPWRKKIQQEIMATPRYPQKSQYGTATLMVALDRIGAVGLKNLNEITIGTASPLYHTNFADRLTRINSCPGCIYHCKHDTQIQEGPYKGEKGGAVEFASTACLGTNCGNYNPDAVLKLTNLCNQYGIDVMTGGNLLGYVMDWYEHGLISRQDTDGIEMTWGNWQSMVAMIHKIAKREGFGDLLAEGPLPAARQIGKNAEKYISHSKGLPWDGEPDTRPFKGYALNLATSTRGADHLRGNPFAERAALGLVSEEVKQRMRDKFGTEDVMFPTSYNKAGLVAYVQDIATTCDALGLCKFYAETSGSPLGFEAMAEGINIVTGIDLDETALRQIAGRIFTVERAFGVREGISKKDDYIFGKTGDEAVPGGTFKGERLDTAKFTKMLEEYYAIRGWDVATGIPMRSTLEKYGLSEIAADLGQSK